MNDRETQIKEINAINAKIKSLEIEREILLQATHIVPNPASSDFSTTPFYSQTLRSLNFYRPIDQFYFYVVYTTGFGIALNGMRKYWHMDRAAELVKRDVVDHDLLAFHRYLSGMNEGEFRNPLLRKVVKIKALGKAAALIFGFTAIIQLKNRNVP
jgi:hypothetical protein